jgi:tRNA(fMet)-specific endonuclease VapC
MERLQRLTCTSIIVAAELRFGALKRGSRALAARIESLLERIEVAPLLPPADSVYADLRASLEKNGKPIGANDMFIAAHALALGCTLVTDNVREFSRVKGLAVENWLR